MDSINILLVDDHPVVIEGMASVLNNISEFNVIDTAYNGKEAIRKLEKLSEVDIIVMDINMPELDGIETTRLVKKKYPKIEVLILTMHKDVHFIRSILEVGGAGYILKNSGTPELIKAIKEIAKGKSYFGEDIKDIVMEGLKSTGKPHTNLTKRELEILKLIAKGLSQQEVADQLHIARYTADTHRKNIFEKLDVHKVTELIKYAMMRGLIED